MKFNLILLAIAIALFPFTILRQLRSEAHFTEYSSIPRMFEGFNDERVAAVIIQKPKAGAQPLPVDPNNPDAKAKVPIDTIAFQKQNNEWVLATGPVKGVKVRGADLKTRLFDPISKIRYSLNTIAFKSATEDQVKACELDDAQAMVVHLLAPGDQPLAQIKIGASLDKAKYDPDKATGTYVAKYDEKSKNTDVIIAEDRFYLEVTEDSWVDRQVLQLDQAKIKSIEIKNPKGQLTLERGEDKNWTTKNKPEKAGNLRQHEVTTILSRIANLNVTKYVEPLNPAVMNQYGIEPPDIMVKVTTDDAKTHTLRVGKKVADKADFYASVEGSPFVLQIGEWDKTPYEKDPMDFFDPLPSGTPASGPGSVPASAPTSQPGNK